MLVRQHSLCRRRFMSVQWLWLIGKWWSRCAAALTPPPLICSARIIPMHSNTCPGSGHHSGWCRHTGRVIFGRGGSLWVRRMLLHFTWQHLPPCVCCTITVDFSKHRATTHSDLQLRAVELGIPVKVIHNASIINAVGAVGLQLYRFGEVGQVGHKPSHTLARLLWLCV